MTPAAPRTPLVAGGDSDLCVLFACHEWICAVSSRWVRRLLLRDAITQTSRPGIIGAEKVLWAEFDLGTLFGRGPLRDVWVLMTVDRGEAQARIALSCGPCIGVQTVGALTPLPRGVFRERLGGIAGAFPTSVVRERKLPSPVGLYLWPPDLFSADEFARGEEIALTGRGGEGP